MKIIYYPLLICLFLSCTNNESSPVIVVEGCTNDTSLNYNPNASVDDGSCELYNSQYSIIENLNNGVSISDLVSNVGANSIYGLEYSGGYVFHFNEDDNSLIVASDYSQIGNVPWGDIFPLDTSTEIGSGDLNTQLIVDGNLNDNSEEGFEHGNDDYVFKIVSELEHNGFNDWFIPSRDSMTSIYNNVHSVGLGNFFENIIYWSSTKIGYDPYVMGFNFDSWGGEPFLGNCASPNGVIISRKVIR
jgi:hypothetical protein